MRALRTTLLCGAAVAAMTAPVAAQTASTDQDDGQTRLLIITPQSGTVAAGTETAQTEGADAAEGDADEAGVMAESDGTIVREAEPNTDVAASDPTTGEATSPAAEGAEAVTAQAGTDAPSEESPDGSSTDTTMASDDASTLDGGADGQNPSAMAGAVNAAPGQDDDSAMAEAPDAATGDAPDPATPLGTIGTANLEQDGVAVGEDLTQRSPDLAELAREADGRIIGATDGAPGAAMEGMTAQQAMSILDDMGEAFYERGYRQGYMRGVQEARAQMQAAMMRDQQRLREQQAMRQQAERQPAQPSAEQRMMREMARQQAEQGGGTPQIILVPQGTDMQALMRQLRMMQQGG